jgi:hypothetical protein
MMRSVFRMLFTAAITLSLALGVFSGIGTSLALAATSQPAAAAGYNPVGSVPTGMNYCYPSGYNRQGWRCGWRLAQAPYNLGSYYNGYYGYYGYNGYNGYYGYYPYYNSGYGGRNPYPPVINDYGGLPRFGPYYYNTCYYYNNPYCY